MAHTHKNIKIIFLAVLLIKLFVYREKNAVYRFIKAILIDYDYCRGVIKKYFNKNFIMSPQEEERFQLSNIYWICNKLLMLAIIN